MLIVPIGAYGFVKYKLNSLEKETYNHLLNKYDEDEISKVESKLGVGQLFVVTVVFEDDDIVYEYIKQDGSIIQIEPEPGISDYKHTEK